MLGGQENCEGDHSRFYRRLASARSTIAYIILLVMLFAAPLAGYLAMPTLAALLIITAWNMTEPHKWSEYARGRKSDILLLLLTLVLTVLVDLTVAIGVGVSVGLALRLSRRKTVESDWSEPDR